MAKMMSMRLRKKGHLQMHVKAKQLQHAASSLRGRSKVKKSTALTAAAAERTSSMQSTTASMPRPCAPTHMRPPLSYLRT